MPSMRHLPPTEEKLGALADALASGNVGQVAVAADLLARLTETTPNARLLCSHKVGENLLKTALRLAVDPTISGDTRADILEMLKHCLEVPEGLEIICKENLLRPILESPPYNAEFSNNGVAENAMENGSAELAAVVRHAWLGLALRAVVSTHGAVLEVPQDFTGLQDAVFDLCDQSQDSQVNADALVLLKHLYSQRADVVLTSGESARLAQLLRWGLGEAEHFNGGDAYPKLSDTKVHNLPKSTARVDLLFQERSECRIKCYPGDAAPPTCTATTTVNPVTPQITHASHALRLLSAVGSMPQLRSALFRLAEDTLDVDVLPADNVRHVVGTISCLFRAVLTGCSTDPQAWRALTLVAEIKSIRRIMRDHGEIRGLFCCLLNSLSTPDKVLTEHLVGFLKQIFTGATDQFSSTSPVMFDNLGRADGLKRLLSALLQSWRENVDVQHRGNIVAFLADAMFFAHFTDAWQVHNQSKELINILFDALLWKGVEGTAGLALGNFVSANGHIDLILDHERAADSISNVGWFLKRATPSWDTKMQIYYLWRVLRSRKGCQLLSRHPHADLIMSGLLVGVQSATMEDNEVLGLLECFLSNEHTTPVVLRGDNPTTILEGICELLLSGDADLWPCACAVLQSLLDATGNPGVILTWSGVGRLVAALSQGQHGKDILDSLVPMLQWQPRLIRQISLEFKRRWVSDLVWAGSAGDPVEITVSRGEILPGVLEALRDAKSFRHGMKVRFVGDETGAGDGHRRECFRLVIAALCDLEFGLFKSMDGGRTLHPSSTAADVDPEYLVYFEFFGKLIALALMHRETLPAARFTLAMRKMLLCAGALAVEDMSSVDPEFYKHKVQYLLENKYAEGDFPMTLTDLELTFEDVPQPDLFPDARHELYPGGSHVFVTEENKNHYVELLCDTRMRGAVSAQINAMVDGIQSIVPEDSWHQIQRVINPEEFDLLVCGLREIDLDDWKQNANWDVDKETYDLFWDVISKFNAEQQRGLLEFTTGSPSIPVGGFAQLPGYGTIGDVQRFSLARNLNTSLPVASTCFNTLYLPKYISTSDMSAGLLEAIANRDVGGFYEGSIVG